MIWRRQVSRNSGNSSVPPSANPPWAAASDREEEAHGPKARRAAGSPGSLVARCWQPRRWTRLVQHRPARFANRAAGSWTSPVAAAGELVDRHQVTELPQPRGAGDRASGPRWHAGAGDAGR